MRKKKTIEQHEEEKQEEEGENGENGKVGFHACYLLTSLCPRFKGHTYIGYTVNPQRRIRQHNGEIRSGAYRTKKRRPWEMVLCLYGFPTNVSALQFEWAWQHPTESLAVRKSAATFKSFSGVANKIKLAHTMLNLPPWQSLNITVNYFSTKYMTHSAGCPTLPKHMKFHVCPMNELPCYGRFGECLSESEDDEGSLGSKSDKEPDSNSQTSSSIEIPNNFEGSFHENECEEAHNTTIVQPFPMNLAVEKESSTPANFSKTEFRDKNKLALIDECDPKPDWPGREASIRKVDEEIEVIDLLSPSPQCRLRSVSKKRRVSVISHEIIDLT